MKKTILPLLLLLTITLSLTACIATGNDDACASHVDTDADLKCDICGKTVDAPACESCTDKDGDGLCDICKSELKSEDNPEPDQTPEPEPEPDGIKLIENNKHNFSFVLSKTANGSTVKKTDDLIKKLRDLGYKVEKLADFASTVTDGYEILIGDNVSSRGEKYSIDGHTLGPQGSAVKIIDNKVIIVAGSTEALLSAIDYFTENALGITDTTKKLSNATFLNEKAYEVKQKDFNVTSLKVGEREISDYVIIAGPSVSENKKLAAELQTTLYHQCGYWLPIVNTNAGVTDKYIAIVLNKISGGDGFEIKINDSNLEIISEYRDVTLSLGLQFIEEQITSKSGNISITPLTKNVRDITYEDFGAVGDGKTNDFEAIYNCHVSANEYGHTIVVDGTKTYYISTSDKYIPIRTNVSWNNAHFIIDDSGIAEDDPARSRPIFALLSDTPAPTFTSATSPAIEAINESGGISKGKGGCIDVGLRRPALLVVTNASHKNFIRYGVNANSGLEQKELILVDAFGNVDPSTPFLHDFEQITSVKAFSVEDTPVTVKDAVFTTIANQGDGDGIYYSRNLLVSRSNTTVLNIEHKVVGESEMTNAYSGFFTASLTSNVTFDSCIMQGLLITDSGTYDTTTSQANNVLWKNCIQSNFFAEDGITPRRDTWGIMGSNLCKNLAYEGCRLSRFDAHAGVYNARIVDSDLVHVTIVGGGEALLKNSKIYNNNIFNLRDDYGATWDGDIRVENLTVVNTSDITLFKTSWHNHDFGYPTYLPKNTVIDGITLDIKARIHIFSSDFVYLGDVGAETYNGVPNKNRMTPPVSILIMNTKEKYEFIIPDKSKYVFFVKYYFCRF